MSDPFSARWAVPVREGRVQPVVPVVTALLAGLLIGVTTDPPEARSAPRSETIILPAPAAVPVPAPVLAAALAPLTLPLLPAPTVAAPATPVATPTPAPAQAAPVGSPPADTTPSPTTATTSTPKPGPERAQVKHVFLITLSGQAESATFGSAATAPYLVKSLVPQGVLLPNHFAVTRGELANDLALLSGQGPTPQQQAGCPAFTDVTPASPGDDGQELGDGCVHTGAAGSLVEQLTGLDKPWGAYVQSMGTPCRHPAVGGPDDVPATEPYATNGNPLVHFHGVIDAPSCASHVKDLSALTADLRKPAGRFPAFALLSPDRCHDGADAVCPTGPGGLAAADAFLKAWVPQIKASKAYRDGGLIVITTDETPDATGATGATGASGATGDTGTTGDTAAAPTTTADPATTTAPATTSDTAPAAPPAPPPPVSVPILPPGVSGVTGLTGATGVTLPGGRSAARASAAPRRAASVRAAGPTGASGTTRAREDAGGFQPAYPNVPAGQPGGGRVGLLLISRDLATPGSTLQQVTNHFDLLRSIDDLLGLNPQGYAADPKVKGLPLDTILVKR